MKRRADTRVETIEIQVKLLEYNSRSKTAVVELHGINPDAIIKILSKLQNLIGLKETEDIKEKFIVDNDSESEVPIPNILPHGEPLNIPDPINEDETERTLKESLEILREEEEKEGRI